MEKEKRVGGGDLWPSHLTLSGSIWVATISSSSSSSFFPYPHLRAMLPRFQRHLPLWNSLPLSLTNTIHAIFNSQLYSSHSLNTFTIPNNKITYHTFNILSNLNQIYITISFLSWKKGDLLWSRFLRGNLFCKYYRGISIVYEMFCLFY